MILMFPFSQRRNTGPEDKLLSVDINNYKYRDKKGSIYEINPSAHVQYIVYKQVSGNLINFRLLSTNPTKWSNTLKQLSVFDYFVELALKGLSQQSTSFLDELQKNSLRLSSFLAFFLQGKDTLGTRLTNIPFQRVHKWNTGFKQINTKVEILEQDINEDAKSQVYFAKRQ